MQKKIYVASMEEDDLAKKVDEAVKAVAGVTGCVSTVAKCQVCVDFDESVADIENSINNAISSTGVAVLG